MKVKIKIFPEHLALRQKFGKYGRGREIVFKMLTNMINLRGLVFKKLELKT